MKKRTILVIEGGEELIRKLRGLAVDAGLALEKAVESGAKIVQTAADGAAPGPNIKQEITLKTPSKVEACIGPDKAHWYYRFVETGAGAHGISAKKAGAIAFEGNQGLVITKSVAHTGMAARPFLRPALDNNQTQVRDAVGDEIKRTIDRYTGG